MALPLGGLTLTLTPNLTLTLTVTLTLTRSSVALPLGGRLSERAARANAVAALLRPLYPRLVIYGCSFGGKAAHWATNPNPDPNPDPNLNPNLNPNPNPNQVAYWAAVTAPPGTYAQALIDSGGTMGPASAKTVGHHPIPNPGPNTNPSSNP